MRPIFVGVVLGAAVLAATRGSNPSLEYVVGVAPGSGTTALATVELTVRGLPPGRVRLSGFAARPALDIGELAMRGLDGTPVATRAEDGTRRKGDRVDDVPGFTIAARAPRALVVRYSATLGRRQGDAHVGYSGQCYGLVAPALVATHGRALFLAPEPTERWKNVTVRFDLPPGWAAATPWTLARGATWKAGIDPGDAVEHLVTASIALGRLHVRRMSHRGTTWEFVTPADTPPAMERSALETLEKATRVMTDVFGRGLGRRYLTVVLPKSAAGDEAVGEGWATGQGRTLLPLDVYRLRGFTEDLVDAYTLHAPYRSTFSDARDFWLPSALREYYAATVLARLGRLDEGDHARMLVGRFMDRLSGSTRRPTLERDFDSPAAAVPAGAQAGACLLEHVDRLVRKATQGTRSLDEAVAEMFARGAASSLWDVLPRVAAVGWDGVRARYAATSEPAPVASFPSLEVLGAIPDPPCGPVVRRLRLAITANTAAFLEQCGCKASQSGGAAKRATVLRELRANPTPLALMDVGNSFPTIGDFDAADPLAREEARMALRLLRDDGYAAIAVATNELTWGERFFSDLNETVRPPFVSAVRRAGGMPLAPRSRVVALGGVRLGIVSVFEPPRFRDAEGSYEDHAPEFERPEPMEALRRDVAEVRSRADLICAIGRASPGFARRIAREIPDIDVVATCEVFGFMVDRSRERPRVVDVDSSGFAGRTLILDALAGQYGVTVADLGLDREGRIASAHWAERELGPEVRDDPAVRRELAAFYERVGSAVGAMARVEPPFAADSLRQNGRYAGASACASCHEAEFRQWRSTRHADAFSTLLKKHRQSQPRCVACHVVAFQAPHGYRFGDPRTTLAGVQCEVCHGPAADHAMAPTRVRPAKGSDPRVCLACHTPEHSNHFDFAQRLPLVSHGSRWVAAEHR